LVKKGETTTEVHRFVENRRPWILRIVPAEFWARMIYRLIEIFDIFNKIFL